MMLYRSPLVILLYDGMPSLIDTDVVNLAISRYQKKVLTYSVNMS